MALTPLVVALVVGWAIGILRGGRISYLRRVRINVPLLAILAIGTSVALDRSAISAPSLIALVGIAATIAFVVRNIHLVGVVVVGIGLIANLAPVMLNGAIPVRPGALVEAQIIQPDEIGRVTLAGSRQLSDDSTLLSTLGDTIPLRPTRQVISYGDLILMIGLADVLANAMTRRRRRRHHHFGAIATTKPDQHWGTAPSPRPESPFQYSESPEVVAPLTIDLTSSSATTDSILEPLLDSASQSR